MKQPKKRALRVRVDAHCDYAQLTNALRKLRAEEAGQPLRFTMVELSLLKTLCEDIAKGCDPTPRFFERVKGQAAPARQLVITLDYLTTDESRAKNVSKRWKPLTAQRVRSIVAEHRDEADKIIASMGAEAVRAYVKQMLPVLKRSPSR